MDEAKAAMGSVMDGEATPALLAALLVALRMRGETVEELAGFAAAMRERVVRVDAPEGAIDVVGTGGDGSGTFNISTTAALVVAASGTPVAKHGNRAITSASGSADVLDALGVRIDHDAASAGAALRETGFAFMFAPGFHPAMKHAGPTRREIGVRTAFNLIGPLTNPAGTTRQLLGVADPAAAERIAQVAAQLGTERTFVIHGDGVDELPLDGSGVLYDVTPDGIERRTVDAAALGLGRAPTARLAGGSAADNATITEAVLRGEPGARRDVVLLNAGAALLVASAVDSLEAGIERAALTIDAGLGTELLGAAAGGAPGCRRGTSRSRGGRERPRDGRRAPRPAGRGRGPCARPSHEKAERRRRDRRSAPGRRPRGDGQPQPRRPPRDRRGDPGSAAGPRPARRPRPPRHRRDQAALAVGRRHRGSGRGHRCPRARVRGRRGGRDQRPVRAALVRRLRRRSASGASGGQRPGPGEGIRSRADPASPPARRRRRSRPSARGPAPGSAAGGARRPGTRDRARAARRGARRARAGAGARDECADHRPEQPRSPDARRGHGTGRSTSGARPRRPARHRRIRRSRSIDRRRLASRRLRCRARRRGARPVTRSGRGRRRVRRGRPRTDAIRRTRPPGRS